MQKSYVLQDFSIFRRQFRANWLTILDYIAQIGGGAFSQIDFNIFVKLKKFSKLRSGGGAGIWDCLCLQCAGKESRLVNFTLTNV